MLPLFDSCPIHSFTKSNLGVYSTSKKQWNLVALHTWHAIQDLVNLNASLLEVWAFAKLKICLVRAPVKIVTREREFLVNVTPFDERFASGHRPHIRFIFPTSEGKLIWI